MDVKPVHVLTDHRNLIHIFVPLPLRPNLLRYVLLKVHRLAIHLSRFEFEIDRICETKNVFADILTYWAEGYRKRMAQGSGSIAALYESFIPTTEDTKQVTTEDVKTEQEKYKPFPELRKDDKRFLKRGIEYGFRRMPNISNCKSQ